MRASSIDNDSNDRASSDVAGTCAKREGKEGCEVRHQ